VYLVGVALLGKLLFDKTDMLATLLTDMGRGVRDAIAFPSKRRCHLPAPEA